MHQPAQDKVEDEAEDKYLDLGLDQDLHSFDDPNVQQQLDLLNTVIQDMYQSRNQQEQSQNPQVLPHSQGYTTRAKKPDRERNFGINEKLLELKIKWSNHITWGQLYGCLLSNEKVLQLAWKDTQIILFITTLIDASTTVSRLRKRPNKKDKWIKQAFRDQLFKRLKIPDFIDMYNHLMNGVDQANQIRTYYRLN